MKIGFYCEDEEGLVTRLDKELPGECANITTLLQQFRCFLKSMEFMEDSANTIQHIKWRNVSWNMTDDLEIGEWILVCNENDHKVWATYYTENMFEGRDDITHWAHMPYAYGEYIWEEE